MLVSPDENQVLAAPFVVLLGAISSPSRGG